MKMLGLEILSTTDIERLYQETLALLEEDGVVFNHASALEILDKNGAHVDFKNEIVRFPSGLVKEAVKGTPREHTLHSRSENGRTIDFGAGKTYFSAGGYGKMVVDVRNGERRIGTSKDIERIVTIDDALPAYDVVGSPLFPTDVASHLVQIKAAQLLFTHSTKPFIAESQNLGEAEYVTKMAEALVGGSEALRGKPIIEFYACCTSPLIWHKNFLDVIIHAAKKGIPVSVASAPICGLTGPITLAGMVVLQYAEILSAVTLLHLINPSLPISLGIIPIMMNFGEGNCNVFSPERLLIEAASVNLARLLQLPHHSSVGLTDSKMPTMQAGYEIALGAILLTLAGSELIGPFGNLDDWMTTAPEIHVIDAEIVETIKRIINGFEVSPLTCARHLITEVRLGKSYLALEHTRKFFNVEHKQPTVGFKGSWELLEKEGRSTFMENASKKVNEILRTHQPKPTGDIGAMMQVAKEAERKLASQSAL
jgi:trimethylamine--corrinoid protein Co-methyltransferase